MARHNARLGTLTIASGGTASTALSTLANLKVAIGFSVDLIIYAPAALTGTATVQVSPVESPSAGDWKNLSAGATVITIAAGSAEIVPAAAYFDLQILSSSAEGADRDFIVVAQVDAAI